MTNSLVATEVSYTPAGSVTVPAVTKTTAPEHKEKESSSDDEATTSLAHIIEPLTICIPPELPYDWDDGQHLLPSTEESSSDVSLDATGELVKSMSSLLIMVKSDEEELEKEKTSVTKEKKLEDSEDVGSTSNKPN